MKPFIFEFLKLRAKLQDRSSQRTSSQLSVLQDVVNTLAIADDSFSSTFPNGTTLDGLVSKLGEVADSKLSERASTYQEMANKQISTLNPIVKSLPDVKIDSLKAFLTQTKKHEKSLLEGCETLSDIKAAVEADVIAFGCKDTDLCNLFPDSWIIFQLHALELTY